MIAALLLAAAPAWAELPGAALLEASVDGTIVSWEATRSEDGTRGIVLLVAPSTGTERRVVLLRPDRGAPALVPIEAPALPADAVLLAPAIGPSKATTLLVVREGAIDRLDTSGTPRWVPWLADPVLRTARSVRIEPEASDGAVVYAAGPGSMFAWRIDAAGTARLGEASLPVEVRKQTNGLQLISPAPIPIAGRLATLPEGVGPERIRVYAAPAAPWPPTFESYWGRLPGKERVLDRTILAIDGEPHAVVTTMDATKLEFFGEKRLRVFPLRADRTRGGIEPRFAGETGMNLWQEARFSARDVNGDGKDDLVVAYWKGLRSAKAAIEVRLADGAGGFGPVRKTEVGADEDEPGWLGFDRDVDGDGLPDLVLAAGGHLKVFRGKKSGDGRRVVETSPALDAKVGAPAGEGVAISIGTGGVDGGRFGRGAWARVEDVDGDDAPEIVVASGGTLAIVVPKRSR